MSLTAKASRVPLSADERARRLADRAEAARARRARIGTSVDRQSNRDFHEDWDLMRKHGSTLALEDD